MAMLNANHRRKSKYYSLVLLLLICLLGRTSGNNFELPNGVNYEENFDVHKQDADQTQAGEQTLVGDQTQAGILATMSSAEQDSDQDADIFVAEIFPDQPGGLEQLFKPLARYKKAILGLDAQIEPSDMKEPDEGDDSEFVVPALATKRFGENFPGSSPLQDFTNDEISNGEDRLRNFEKDSRNLQDNKLEGRKHTGYDSYQESSTKPGSLGNGHNFKGMPSYIYPEASGSQENKDKEEKHRLNAGLVSYEDYNSPRDLKFVKGAKLGASVAENVHLSKSDSGSYTKEGAYLSRHQGKEHSKKTVAEQDEINRKEAYGENSDDNESSGSGEGSADGQEESGSGSIEGHAKMIATDENKDSTGQSKVKNLEPRNWGSTKDEVDAIKIGEHGAKQENDTLVSEEEMKFQGSEKTAMKQENDTLASEEEMKFQGSEKTAIKLEKEGEESSGRILENRNVLPANLTSKKQRSEENEIKRVDAGGEESTEQMVKVQLGENKEVTENKDLFASGDEITGTKNNQSKVGSNTQLTSKSNQITLGTSEQMSTNEQVINNRHTLHENLQINRYMGNEQENGAIKEIQQEGNSTEDSETEKSRDELKDRQQEVGVEDKELVVGEKTRGKIMSSFKIEKEPKNGTTKELQKGKSSRDESNGNEAGQDRNELNNKQEDGELKEKDAKIGEKTEGKIVSSFSNKNGPKNGTNKFTQQNNNSTDGTQDSEVGQGRNDLYDKQKDEELPGKDVDVAARTGGKIVDIFVDNALESKKDRETLQQTETNNALQNNTSTVQTHEVLPTTETSGIIKAGVTSQGEEHSGDSFIEKDLQSIETNSEEGMAQKPRPATVPQNYISGSQAQKGHAKGINNPEGILQDGNHSKNGLIQNNLQPTETNRGEQTTEELGPETTENTKVKDGTRKISKQGGEAFEGEVTKDGLGEKSQQSGETKNRGGTKEAQDHETEYNKAGTEGLGEPIRNADDRGMENQEAIRKTQGDETRDDTALRDRLEGRSEQIVDSSKGNEISGDNSSQRSGNMTVKVGGDGKSLEKDTISDYETNNLKENQTSSGLQSSTGSSKIDFRVDNNQKERINETNEAVDSASSFNNPNDGERKHATDNGIFTDLGDKEQFQKRNKTANQTDSPKAAEDKKGLLEQKSKESKENGQEGLVTIDKDDLLKTRLSSEEAARKLFLSIVHGNNTDEKQTDTKVGERTDKPANIDKNSSSVEKSNDANKVDKNDKKKLGTDKEKASKGEIQEQHFDEGQQRESSAEQEASEIKETMNAAKEVKSGGAENEVHPDETLGHGPEQGDEDQGRFTSNEGRLAMQSSGNDNDITSVNMTSFSKEEKPKEQPGVEESPVVVNMMELNTTNMADIGAKMNDRPNGSVASETREAAQQLNNPFDKVTEQLFGVKLQDDSMEESDAENRQLNGKEEVENETRIHEKTNLKAESDYNSGKKGEMNYSSNVEEQIDESTVKQKSNTKNTSKMRQKPKARQRSKERQNAKNRQQSKERLHLEERQQTEVRLHTKERQQSKERQDAKNRQQSKERLQERQQSKERQDAKERQQTKERLQLKERQQTEVRLQIKERQQSKDRKQSKTKQGTRKIKSRKQKKHRNIHGNNLDFSTMLMSQKARELYMNLIHDTSRALMSKKRHKNARRRQFQTHSKLSPFMATQHLRASHNPLEDTSTMQYSKSKAGKTGNAVANVIEPVKGVHELASKLLSTMMENDQKLLKQTAIRPIGGTMATARKHNVAEKLDTPSSLIGKLAELKFDVNFDKKAKEVPASHNENLEDASLTEATFENENPGKTVMQKQKGVGLSSNVDLDKLDGNKQEYEYKIMDAKIQGELEQLGDETSKGEDIGQLASKQRNASTANLTQPVVRARPSTGNLSVYNTEESIGSEPRDYQNEANDDMNENMYLKQKDVKQFGDFGQRKNESNVALGRKLKDREEGMLRKNEEGLFKLENVGNSTVSWHRHPSLYFDGNSSLWKHHDVVSMDIDPLIDVFYKVRHENLVDLVEHPDLVRKEHKTRVKGMVWDHQKISQRKGRKGKGRYLSKHRTQSVSQQLKQSKQRTRLQQWIRRMQLLSEQRAITPQLNQSEQRTNSEQLKQSKQRTLSEPWAQLKQRPLQSQRMLSEPWQQRKPSGAKSIGGAHHRRKPMKKKGSKGKGQGRKNRKMDREMGRKEEERKVSHANKERKMGHTESERQMTREKNNREMGHAEVELKMSHAEKDRKIGHTESERKMGREKNNLEGHAKDENKMGHAKEEREMSHAEQGSKMSHEANEHEIQQADNEHEMGHARKQKHKVNTKNKAKILRHHYKHNHKQPVQGTAKFGISGSEQSVSSPVEPKFKNNMPRNVKYFLIENAAKRGALCIDGSIPGYYLRRGFGTGEKNWIIHLHGGAWCYDAQTCYRRSFSILGSTNHWSAENITNFFQGFLSDKKEVNPYFHNWNVVVQTYCDGGLFSGKRKEPLEINGRKLYFRGRPILKALVESLKRRNLESAADIILSGTSAGGLAVLLQGDYLKHMLPKTATVRGLVDAGFFLDSPSEDGSNVVENQFKGLFDIHRPKLRMKCESGKDNSTKYKCLFPQQTILHTKLPVYFVNALYDHWQLSELQRLHCVYNNDKCIPEQRDRILNFRTLMYDHLLDALGHMKHAGLFADSCIGHGQVIVDYTWTRIRVNNQTISDAFNDWFNDRSGEKRHINADCRYPCNGSCPRAMVNSCIKNFKGASSKFRTKRSAELC